MPKLKTMRRLLFITASLFIGFFSVALYSCDKPVPPEPSTAPVDGTWQSISDKKNSEGAPQFVLTLNLKFENSNISGNYCFITRYGKKIDCDNAGIENIKGDFSNQTDIAKVSFKTFFNGEKGKAQLAFINDCQLKWTLLKMPVEGGYFGPKNAIFHKKSCAQKNTSDSKGNHRSVTVKAKRAWLHQTPDSSSKLDSYVVASDQVLLLDRVRNDNGNTWCLIKYKRNDRELDPIVHWLKCSDLNL